MAATRKSAKGAAAKKRRAAKRSSSVKKSPRKRSSKARSGQAAPERATTLKRKARRGLKAARGGLDTVLQAGEKTWETLKSTTAQVVEGVVEGMKDTFVGESKPVPRRPRSR